MLTLHTCHFMLKNQKISNKTWKTSFLAYFGWKTSKEDFSSITNNLSLLEDFTNLNSSKNRFPQNLQTSIWFYCGEKTEQDNFLKNLTPSLFDTLTSCKKSENFRKWFWRKSRGKLTKGIRRIPKYLLIDFIAWKVPCIFMTNAQILFLFNDDKKTVWLTETSATAACVLVTQKLLYFILYQSLKILCPGRQLAHWSAIFILGNLFMIINTC